MASRGICDRPKVPARYLTTHSAKPKFPHLRDHEWSRSVDFMLRRRTKTNLLAAPRLATHSCGHRDRVEMTSTPRLQALATLDNRRSLASISVVRCRRSHHAWSDAPRPMPRCSRCAMRGITRRTGDRAPFGLGQCHVVHLAHRSLPSPRTVASSRGRIMKVAAPSSV